MFKYVFKSTDQKPMVRGLFLLAFLFQVSSSWAIEIYLKGSQFYIRDSFRGIDEILTVSWLEQRIPDPIDRGEFQKHLKTADLENWLRWKKKRGGDAITLVDVQEYLYLEGSPAICSKPTVGNILRAIPIEALEQANASDSSGELDVSLVSLLARLSDFDPKEIQLTDLKDLQRILETPRLGHLPPLDDRIKFYNHTIRILANRQFQPKMVIRELISNGIDSYRNQLSTVSRRVDVNQPSPAELKVKDYGQGMSLHKSNFSLLMPSQSDNPVFLRPELADQTTTGRFGEGFYSVLSFLNDPTDRVVVESHAEGAKPIQLNLYKDTQGEYRVKFAPSLKKEFGSEITIHSRMLPKISATVKETIREIFEYDSKASISFGGSPIVEKKPDLKEEFFFSSGQKLRLLKSEEVLSSGQGMLKLLVNGKLFKNLPTHGVDVYPLVVIDFPASTPITSDRETFLYTEPVIQKAINSLVNHATESEDFALLNSLSPYLGDEGFQILSRLKLSFKKSAVLPATEEFSGISEINGLKVGRLDPKLLEQVEVNPLHSAQYAQVWSFSPSKSDHSGLDFRFDPHLKLSRGSFYFLNQVHNLKLPWTRPVLQTILDSRKLLGEQHHPVQYYIKKNLLIESQDLSSHEPAHANEVPKAFLDHIGNKTFSKRTLGSSMMSSEEKTNYLNWLWNHLEDPKHPQTFSEIATILNKFLPLSYSDLSRLEANHPFELKKLIREIDQIVKRNTNQPEFEDFRIKALGIFPGASLMGNPEFAIGELKEVAIRLFSLNSLLSSGDSESFALVQKKFSKLARIENPEYRVALLNLALTFAKKFEELFEIYKRDFKPKNLSMNEMSYGGMGISGFSSPINLHQYVTFSQHLSSLYNQCLSLRYNLSCIDLVNQNLTLLLEALKQGRDPLSLIQFFAKQSLAGMQSQVSSNPSEYVRFLYEEVLTPERQVSLHPKVFSLSSYLITSLPFLWNGARHQKGELPSQSHWNQTLFGLAKQIIRENEKRLDLARIERLFYGFQVFQNHMYQDTTPGLTPKLRYEKLAAEGEIGEDVLPWIGALLLDKIPFYFPESKDFQFPEKRSLTPLHQHPDLIRAMSADTELNRKRILMAIRQNPSNSWEREVAKNSAQAGSTRIDVKVYRHGDGLVIRVKDIGQGAPPEKAFHFYTPKFPSKDDVRLDSNIGWGFFTVLNHFDQVQVNTSDGKNLTTIDLVHSDDQVFMGKKTKPDQKESGTELLLVSHHLSDLAEPLRIEARLQKILSELRTPDGKAVEVFFNGEKLNDVYSLKGKIPLATLRANLPGDHLPVEIQVFQHAFPGVYYDGALQRQETASFLQDIPAPLLKIAKKLPSSLAFLVKGDLAETATRTTFLRQSELDPLFRKAALDAISRFIAAENGKAPEILEKHLSYDFYYEFRNGIVRLPDPKRIQSIQTEKDAAFYIARVPVGPDFPSLIELRHEVQKQLQLHGILDATGNYVPGRKPDEVQLESWFPQSTYSAQLKKFQNRIVAAMNGQQNERDRNDLPSGLDLLRKKIGTPDFNTSEAGPEFAHLKPTMMLFEEFLVQEAKERFGKSIEISFYVKADLSDAHARLNFQEVGINLLGESFQQFYEMIQNRSFDLESYMSIMDTLSHELIHLEEQSHHSTHDPEFFKKQQFLLEKLFKLNDDPHSMQKLQDFFEKGRTFPPRSTLH